MKVKVFYFLTLAIVLILLGAAVIQSDFYRTSKISVSEAISFSAALQWAITGGYLLTLAGMLMFGPVMISAAAFAAALGYFNIWIILAIAVLGEMAADLILYAIGYFSRAAVVENCGRYFGMTKEKTGRLENLVHAHPIKTMTAIKMTPILPVPGLMLVGSMHMSLKKFAVINLVISSVRAAIFLSIGYYFGYIYDSVSHYIKNAEYVLLAGIVTVFAVYYAYKKIEEKISKKLSD